MTTCARAIQEWENRNQTSAAEAREVKLIGWIPPINKMDQGLNQLVNCTKLSLSTNNIEKIMNLSSLRNLEILSLGRNNIKKISGLDDVGASLQQLWISYNQIDKLDGLQACVRLTTLFISNNKIRNWEEINRLNQLPELRNILLIGNPIYDAFPNREEAKPQVLRRCRQLEVIDGVIVSEAVKRAADEMKD